MRAQAWIPSSDISRQKLKLQQKLQTKLSEAFDCCNLNHRFKRQLFSQIDTKNCRSKVLTHCSSSIQKSSKSGPPPLQQKGNPFSWVHRHARHVENCSRTTWTSAQRVEQRSNHSSSSRSQRATVSVIMGSSSPTRYKYSGGTSSVRKTVFPAR